MQIGMFYQMQVPRPSSRSYEADRFLEMLDQVAYAEEMGLTSVWMADHQFRTEWSHSSAPDVTLGALSQRTTRMRLGIAVVVPPVQHPLHIAARTATLDILSKGRVDLGVGRSGYPYQMAAFGTDLEDATGMVDEALEIIPRAWTEGEFTYQGNHYKIPLREVHPKPVQQPHPPIWLGCSQEDTFRKAGLMGLGCLAMAGGGATGLAPLVQAYRGGIRNASPTTGVVHNRVAVSNRGHLRGVAQEGAGTLRRIDRLVPPSAGPQGRPRVERTGPVPRSRRLPVALHPLHRDRLSKARGSIIPRPDKEWTLLHRRPRRLYPLPGSLCRGGRGRGHAPVSSGRHIP